MIFFKKTFSIILAMFLSLFIITLSIKLVLNFRPLYYIDIDYLSIPSHANISKEKIIYNYNILIDYLNPYNKSQLNFPDFNMSYEGRIHFEEVKEIFNKTNLLFILCLLVSILGSFYSIKFKKDLSFLKYSCLLTLLIPLLLVIPFVINFDKYFTKFHKIFFSNDYWIFNPETDPIINILPQKFFFHSTIAILILLTLASIITVFIYKKLHNNLSMQS